MKAMNTGRKTEVQFAMKKGIDISPLLVGYDIKGMDLSGAIIQTLDVSGQDITGTNFSNATIGIKENSMVNLNNAIVRDCGFVGTYFPGKVMCRRADFRGCNFTGAYFPYADYKFANFSNCNWCDCVFTIGTVRSFGAIFDSKFFGDLTKHWAIKIVPKSMEELNVRPIEEEA